MDGSSVVDAFGDGRRGTLREQTLRQKAEEGFGAIRWDQDGLR